MQKTSKASDIISGPPLILGSNSFYGYCINAIKMNYKALLKGEKNFEITFGDSIATSHQNYVF